MNIVFQPLSKVHQTEVIDIFNYYVENSFAAYPSEKVTNTYFEKFLIIAGEYPSYVIKSNDKIIGFCYLSAYNPLHSFDQTAVITYFVHHEYRGKGIGSTALYKLEEEAMLLGITNILANISSLNYESIAFHYKNGFEKCGEFKGVINKNEKTFDIIWMQRSLI